MSFRDLLGPITKAIAKQKAMAFFLGVAIVVLVLILRGNQASTPQTVDAPPGPGVQEVPKRQVTKRARMKSKEVPKEAEALLMGVGRDDPFHLMKRGLVSRTIESGAFILEGIIWDEKRPLAIINNEIVGEGQTLDGRTVIEIQNDHIVVEERGHREVLSLADELEEKGLE